MRSRAVTIVACCTLLAVLLAVALSNKRHEQFNEQRAEAVSSGNHPPHTTAPHNTAQHYAAPHNTAAAMSPADTIAAGASSTPRPISEMEPLVPFRTDSNRPMNPARTGDFAIRSQSSAEVPAIGQHRAFGSANSAPRERVYSQEPVIEFGDSRPRGQSVPSPGGAFVAAGSVSTSQGGVAANRFAASAQPYGAADNYSQLSAQNSAYASYPEANIQSPQIDIRGAGVRAPEVQVANVLTADAYAQNVSNNRGPVVDAQVAGSPSARVIPQTQRSQVPSSQAQSSQTSPVRPAVDPEFSGSRATTDGTGESGWKLVTTEHVPLAQPSTPDAQAGEQTAPAADPLLISETDIPVFRPRVAEFPPLHSQQASVAEESSPQFYEVERAINPDEAQTLAEDSSEVEVEMFSEPLLPRSAQSSLRSTPIVVATAADEQQASNEPLPGSGEYTDSIGEALQDSEFAAVDPAVESMVISQSQIVTAQQVTDENNKEALAFQNSLPIEEERFEVEPVLAMQAIPQLSDSFPGADQQQPAERNSGQTRSTVSPDDFRLESVLDRPHLPSIEETIPLTQSEGQPASSAESIFAAPVPRGNSNAAPLTMRLEGPEKIFLGEPCRFNVLVENTTGERVENPFIAVEVDPSFEAIDSTRLHQGAAALEPGQKMEVEFAMVATAAGRFPLTMTTGAAGIETDERTFTISTRLPVYKLSVSGPEIMNLGSEADFSLQIENTSAQPLKDVEVQLTLPRGMNTTILDREADVDTESGTIVWSVPVIRTGFSEIIRFRVKVTGRGELESIVSVTTPDSPSSESSFMTSVVSRNNLGIQIKDNPNTLPTGTPVGVEFHVDNWSGEADHDVVLTLELPEGVTAYADDNFQLVGDSTLQSRPFDLAAGANRMMIVNVTGESGGIKPVEASISSSYSGSSNSDRCELLFHSGHSADENRVRQRFSRSTVGANLNR